MNKEQIENFLIKHIPSLSGEKISIERCSGLTNITYAVNVNGVPLYIFKEFTEGISHDFELKICNILSRKGLIPYIVYSDKHYRIE